MRRIAKERRQLVTEKINLNGNLLTVQDMLDLNECDYLIAFEEDIELHFDMPTAMCALFCTVGLTVICYGAPLFAAIGG